MIDERAAVIRLIEGVEGEASVLVPLSVVREFARIRQNRLTGTLELDFKDGQAQSRRWIPPRVRIDQSAGREYARGE